MPRLPRSPFWLAPTLVGTRAWRGAALGLGLIVSVGCSSSPTAPGSHSRTATWTVQLDQDQGGTPGRMWFIVNLTLRDDPAQGSCNGSTVTTSLGDFTGEPGRIQPASSGTTHGSWTQGTGNCDAFSLTLSPRNLPDYIVTGTRQIPLTALTDSGFGAVDGSVFIAGTWSNGTRQGTAYVYPAQLGYLPDSHFDLQILVSEGGCDPLRQCLLNRYNAAADLCAHASAPSSPTCGLVAPRGCPTEAGDCEWFWVADTTINAYLPRKTQAVDDRWYFSLLEENDNGGPNFQIGCDRAPNGPDLVQIQVVSGVRAPVVRCQSGWTPTVLLSKTAGDQQTAPVGTTLPVPLQVQLLTGAGVPQANAEITWTVTSGGGSLSTTSSTTDASGHASVLWTLGGVAGQQTVSATGGIPNGGTAAVIFQATAQAVASTLTVSANPLIAPTGGTTTLSAVVTGGIGPFTHAWHGYRDDGSPFSFTFSDVTAANPQVSLTFPGSDFYFFVEVTDNGIPVGQPGHIARGYVRVHESDDALAAFSVVGGPFQANVTNVSFDATASTGVTPPLGWTLQYLGNVAAPSGIEGFLTLQANSNGTLFWDNVFTTTTTAMTLTVPAATLAAPGAYRMLLQVNGAVSTHQTYEYFMVGP